MHLKLILLKRSIHSGEIGARYASRATFQFSVYTKQSEVSRDSTAQSFLLQGQAQHR